MLPRRHCGASPNGIYEIGVERPRRTARDGALSKLNGGGMSLLEKDTLVVGTPGKPSAYTRMPNLMVLGSHQKELNTLVYKTT